MKTLGMIGGVGPESTIDYYKNIIALYRERQRDGSYPQFVINSIDLKKGIDFMNANDLAAMAGYLLDEITKLAHAGADFGLIAANTPHIVFDDVAPKSPIPLISIVEATCAYAKARRMRRLALFGTRYTMQGDFYQKVFTREGLELIVPESKDQDYIHEKYFSELVPGNFLPETRAELLAIIDRMKAKIDPPSRGYGVASPPSPNASPVEDSPRRAWTYGAAGIDGVILAGTELPLLLRGESHNGVSLLDTGKIHCQAAVNAMFS
jgi:aspartate racemase